MKLLLLLMLMIELPSSLAQSPAISPAPPSSVTVVTASLSRTAVGESASAFTTETPKIYLRWHGESLKAGAMVRCIWIAEDVGKSAPANYHVDEATAKANEPQDEGIFTLSKPKAGWPEGKYRAELYLGMHLVETVPFAIEKPRGD